METEKQKELRHAKTLAQISKEELAEANKMKKGGAIMAFKPFEKSKQDKEPKGMKEGSKKEEAFDKKQMKFAKGGSVDGIAQRGKTQGRIVKMACGGKAKKK